MSLTDFIGPLHEKEVNSIGRQPDGKIARRTYGTTSPGSILNGIYYDALSVSYPTSTTEVYSFFEGGLTGTLLATVTITYSAASKNEITSVVRVTP